MRKQKKQPILTNVLVENVAAEGKSIAKVDGKVIFIEQTVPGDIVDIQIIKSKKDWAEAYPIAFKQYSSNRVNPFCSHFGVCGGCQWQMLPYQLQLQHKQQQVADHLTRIGKIAMPPIASIIGATNIEAYRNKIEYTFATRRFIPKEEFQQLKKQYPEATANEIAAQVGGAAGFHAKGMFDKVVKIDKCYLQNNLGNQFRDAITQLAQQHQIPFYDIKSHVGFLRNMMIRITEVGEVMINLVVGASNTKWENICTNYLKQHFPAITSLYLTVNTKFNDSIFDLNPQLVYGKPYVLENLEDFQFKISPKSFFQTNTQQALQLYKVTRDFAELTGKEVLYDLYCGTGSIGIFCSKQVQKIVGVEVVAEAIEDAKENAAFNGINNSFFTAGDVIDICDDAFFDTHGKPDVIITDPPRAGMHEKLVRKILDIEAPLVVYVSCNPATQARDLALLAEKYAVTKVQPVDMFPHTHHIENVVQLKLHTV